MSDPKPAPAPSVPAEVFQTEAWFSNLLLHGFVNTPTVVQLRVSSAAGDVSLSLMLANGGRELHALGNYYTSMYGPIGRADALDAEEWRSFACNLHALPGSAVVQLQPLDASSEWLAALEAALCAQGYWCDRFFCFGNWYQPVPIGGFSVYWAGRPSALRHSVERGRRRLTKAGTWRTEITSTESPALESAIAAYETVYAQSWKQPEPCSGFMPGLIRTAAREGWLRLGVLWLNDQPLAAQVWLVHGGKANIYKLAYVQGFERLSAGSVLTTALMQHTMDVDCVQEVDYLSGDDAYKADWMALRRERVGLLAFDKRHWRGWLAAAPHGLGRLRQWIFSKGKR